MPMNDHSDILRSFIIEGTPEDIIERYESLPTLAETVDFGDLDSNVVVIDTETTGVSTRKDELTQIAAARLEKGKIVEWFVTYVDPGREIPTEITHLTGITDEDVKGAPTPNEALHDLVEFVGNAKIVAHNAEFDKYFTTAHTEGYPLTKNLWIDSLELARIALPRLKSHRLLDLVRAFDAPLSTHRADEDVTATCALYRILLAAVSQMPPGLIKTISTLTTYDVWPSGKVFAYFAEQNRRADQENGIETQPVFSLRTIRRNRISSSDKKPKKDAENLNPLDLCFPSSKEIEDAFTSSGIVGSQYESFEDREEQVVMSNAVRRAFQTSKNLVVEAGTGVGKSMAYLLPAALVAKKNDISVGIATKTNALLDQLIYKELPALSAALEGGLGYTALKGFIHYPCLRKVQRLVTEGAQMRMVQSEEKTQAPALAALLSFIEQTEYGDLDNLKIDYRVLPKYIITTTSAECLRKKCPFYGTSCFVHGLRRKAETSDIVVTNHSLFFCDVAANGLLLPPIRYWVVDEAHGAEAEARAALSLELSAQKITNLIARVGEGETSRNIFVRAERNLIAPKGDSDDKSADNIEDPGTLFYALTKKAKDAGVEFAEAAGQFCSHITDLLYFDTERRSSYDILDLWINDDVRRTTVFESLSEYAVNMVEKSEKLIGRSQDLVAFLEDFENAAVIQREIAATAIELKDIVIAAQAIFIDPSDEYVYSATISRKSSKRSSKENKSKEAFDRNAIYAQLYNVGAKLDETLYVDTNSIVFTSATLSIDNSFKSFEQAMGLNTSEQSEADELMLKSSYDFDRNMTVYVIKDMPEPNTPQYIEELKELLVDIHRAQNGSMLTLFTNKKEMEECYTEVYPRLRLSDLRLVCQRWGVSIKGLRDDFLEDETLSLFALKSFWEGFDAPGSTLKGVTIPKLPFKKPTDPLSCEQAFRDDAAWRNYVLPQAVIEIKQAAGRLIRRADDSGVLILADSRLVSKGYGRVFLNSLPSNNIHIVTKDEVVQALIDDAVERAD